MKIKNTNGDNKVKETMHILLTNDDGIHAEGLTALYHRFRKDHHVTVVAPDGEQSAVGHGITLNHPIRVTEMKLPCDSTGYAVSGTPVDCIKLAFLELLPSRPDLVVSGINRGANLGVNINYSGTAAAAREATLYRVPAIAASIQGQQGGDFIQAAEYIHELAMETASRELPVGTFLNVNFPGVSFHEIKGIRVCRQGLSFPDEYLDKRKDPRNRTYYWHGCEFTITETDPAIDSGAVEDGYISVTPVKCDLTDNEMLTHLSTWEIVQSIKKLKN